MVLRQKPRKLKSFLNSKNLSKHTNFAIFKALLNFYRRFLPNATQIQGKLQLLIKGNKKKDNSQVVWNDNGLKAFEQCQIDMANVTLLAHPIPNSTLALHVDASNFSVGAVLHQIHSGQLQPLTQKRYSTNDRELLAIYQAIKHNKFMFDGRECIINH